MPGAMPPLHRYLGNPVLTGIGHEVDRSIADEVAHTAHKTPTAAAAAVVNRVRAYLADVDECAAALRDGDVALLAADRLGQADERQDDLGRPLWLVLGSQGLPLCRPPSLGQRMAADTASGACHMACTLQRRA